MGEALISRRGGGGGGEITFKLVYEYHYYLSTTETYQLDADKTYVIGSWVNVSSAHTRLDLVTNGTVTNIFKSGSYAHSINTSTLVVTTAKGGNAAGAYSHTYIYEVTLE